MKKKILSILAVGLTGLLCLTGCEKKDPYEEAVAKMQDLDSYRLTYNIVASVETEGITLDMPIKLDMAFDMKNHISKVDSSITMLGMTFTTEGYVDSNDPNHVITYQKTIGEDTWTKSVSEEPSMTGSDILSDIENPEQVSSDDSIYLYRANISKEVLSEVIATASTDAADSSMFQVNGDTTMDIEVDKETGYITRLYMDLTDAVSVSSEDVSMTKMTFEFLLSDFNEVGTLTIDQNIIDNAMDQDMIDAMTYADTYIDAIEWEVLYDSYDSYTNVDLEYDGPKPDKVDVQIVDGYVTDGVIVVNGYTVQIVDGEVQTPTGSTGLLF